MTRIFLLAKQDNQHNMNKQIYTGSTKYLYWEELKYYCWENSKVLLHQVALFFFRFLNYLFFTVKLYGLWTHILVGSDGLKLKTSCWICFSFCLLKMLTDGLECCGLLVDYCDVFISCLDSHSDGTHSLPSVSKWFNATFIQICSHETHLIP